MAEGRSNVNLGSYWREDLSVAGWGECLGEAKGRGSAGLVASSTTLWAEWTCD